MERRCCGKEMSTLIQNAVCIGVSVLFDIVCERQLSC